MILWIDLRRNVLADDAASFFTCIHPDDLEDVRREMSRAARFLSAVHMEYRIEHPNNGERWVELHAKPVHQMGLKRELERAAAMISVFKSTDRNFVRYLGDEARFLIAGPGQPRPADFNVKLSTGTLSQWRRR